MTTCTYPDYWSDRTVCVRDDWMHTRCTECGRPLDGECGRRADERKERCVNIADELAAFETRAGAKCRIAGLVGSVEYSDLMEAISLPAQHAAVARWWNTTRVPGTTLPEITAEQVARHRAKECVSCR